MPCNGTACIDTYLGRDPGTFYILFLSTTQTPKSNAADRYLKDLPCEDRCVIPHKCLYQQPPILPLLPSSARRPPTAASRISNPGRSISPGDIDRERSERIACISCYIIQYSIRQDQRKIYQRSECMINQERDMISMVCVTQGRGGISSDLSGSREIH